MNEKPEIVFGSKELSAEQRDAYRQKIDNARRGVNAIKGNEPVGSIPRPNMPDFQKIREAQATQFAPPDNGGVQPRPPGSSPLSPQTEQQLKDIAKAQAHVQESPEEKPQQEEHPFDVIDSLLDQKSESEKILNNKKRREEIESRCEPMKFEDLLFKNEVQQKIPIIPGKFEPVFRSMTPEESLFVKKYLAKEQAVSDQYTLEKYSMCLLTCSLVAINDVQLPDHRDNKGEPVERLFEAKMRVIMKKSGYIIADLGLNYTWFDIRVRKLITVDGLKNG